MNPTRNLAAISAVAGIATAGLITIAAPANASAATPPAVSPSTAVLKNDVAAAVRAGEYITVTHAKTTGDHTIEFRALSGTGVKTLRLTNTATTELVALWKAATARPHSVTPDVNRQSCDGGNDQTAVFNYHYTAALCFGDGEGNVAVYEIDEIDAGAHAVAYAVSGGPTSGRLLYLNSGDITYFNASDNVELTFLNVYS